MKKFSRYKNVSSRKDILLKNINIFLKDVSYDNFGNGFSNPSTFDSSSQQMYLFCLKKGVIYFWRYYFYPKKEHIFYFKVSSVFFKACRVQAEISLISLLIIIKNRILCFIVQDYNFKSRFNRKKRVYGIVILRIGSMYLTSPSYLFQLKVHLYLSLKNDQGKANKVRRSYA